LKPTPQKTFKVKVTPGAKRYLLQEGKRGVIQISVKEPAQAGLANEAVRRLIAEHLNVPVSTVLIMTGHQRSVKMIGVWKQR